MPHFTTGKLTTPDGALISYLTCGHGPRRMVYIPGAGDGVASAGDAARGLSWWMRGRERYFEVLYISRREPLHASTSLHTQAQDMIWVMEQLCWGPSIVEGQSAGGLIAQLMAASRPDLVPLLVLSSSAAHLDDCARAHCREWLDLIEQNRWGAFFEHFAMLLWRDTRLAILRPFQRLLHQATCPQHPERLTHIIKSLLDVDHRSILPQVQAPTLVIGGAQDKIFGPELQNEMASALPNSTLLLTQGYGHGHDLENPLHIQRVAAFARLHNARLKAPRFGKTGHVA